MANTIPANQIVRVIPSVVAAGGVALELNGLLLTTSTRVPIGVVESFPTLATVEDYFGPSSAEAAMAAVYFRGFEGSTQKPGELLFRQYPHASPVAAFLRGGSLAAMTLAQLQALTGTISLTVNGGAQTSSSISLAGATSFSNAATLIAAGFTAPPFAVTYDSIASAFLFTSTTTGVSATITFATGTISTALKLTAATGAVISQGANVAVPATEMSAVVDTTTNWASFATMFEPSDNDKLALALWTNGQENRYVYSMWSTDIADTQVGGSAVSNAIDASNYAGTAMTYCLPTVDPTGLAAVFLMGAIASLDFGAVAGRSTMAFRRQSGMPNSVTNAAAAAYLIEHKVNFYGIYATANDEFEFYYPGRISGDFIWTDSYVNQIWMSNQFQLALMGLLVQAKSIPYNAPGYTRIKSSMLDPILQAVNFGAVQPGVTLSNAQIAEVNTSAGVPIDAILSTTGWYMQVQDALPQVRAARGSPPCNFWYMDGGSVHQIVLNSIAVQ